MIDDEVIHRREGHEHVEPVGPKEPREYEPFITDNPTNAPDLDPVKVAAVKPPEKHFLPEPEPYKMPDRHATKYEIDEIPLFDLGYKAIIRTEDDPKEDEHVKTPAEIAHEKHGHDTSALAKAAEAHEDGHGHGHHDEKVPHEPLLTPFPTEVYGSAVPAHPETKALTPVDDIWGSYLAKWKPKDEKKEKPKPVEPWKPASYQPFDFGNYLLRARQPAVDGEPEAPRKAYWWEQPKAARAPGKQLAWWDRLIAEKHNGPAHVGPAVDVVPGPKGGAAIVEQPPQPAYQPYAPKKSYGSFKPSYSTKTAGTAGTNGKYWWQK